MANTLTASIESGAALGLTETLELTEVHARGRRFLLAEPITCSATREDGYHVFACPAFGLSGYARSRAEALSDLHEEFAALYDGLIGEPDAALTLDARELRDRLQQAVRRVETEPREAEPREAKPTAVAA